MLVFQLYGTSPSVSCQTDAMNTASLWSLIVQSCVKKISPRVEATKPAAYAAHALPLPAVGRVGSPKPGVLAGNRAIGPLPIKPLPESFVR